MAFACPLLDGALQDHRRQQEPLRHDQPPVVPLLHPDNGDLGDHGRVGGLVPLPPLIQARARHGCKKNKHVGPKTSLNFSNLVFKFKENIARITKRCPSNIASVVECVKLFLLKYVTITTITTAIVTTVTHTIVTHTIVTHTIVTHTIVTHTIVTITIVTF